MEVQMSPPKEGGGVGVGVGGGVGGGVGVGVGGGGGGGGGGNGEKKETYHSVTGSDTAKLIVYLESVSKVCPKMGVNIMTKSKVGPKEKLGVQSTFRTH
ncbi:Hypothetical predicted protein [Octopus vulgaris]|uniref:Uncharacterized protein n=1 Tax=Octopus vulgaris TaxID=6645 RepID=A0AA36ALP0_OCTVU|nr:Hypothetical predicted protein [Octopus vulgaris]